MENEIQKALDLIVDEKYADALELLMPLANNGNIEAQANIGFLYQNGLGVDRDIKKAINWLTEAADRGSGMAAHNLRHCLLPPSNLRTTLSSLLRIGCHFPYLLRRLHRKTRCSD